MLHIKWSGKILKLSLNQSCGPDENHPQILIELEDHVSNPFNSPFKENHR